jgi:hypothetical protein
MTDALPKLAALGFSGIAILAISAVIGMIGKMPASPSPAWISVFRHVLALALICVAGAAWQAFSLSRKAEALGGRVEAQQVALAVSSTALELVRDSMTAPEPADPSSFPASGPGLEETDPGEEPATSIASSPEPPATGGGAASLMSVVEEALQATSSALEE